MTDSQSIMLRLLAETNKYLQAASKTKCNAQARLVEAILPVHLLPGKTAEAVAP